MQKRIYNDSIDFLALFTAGELNEQDDMYVWRGYSKATGKLAAEYNYVTGEGWYEEADI